jgi:3-methyladenine DNA glycosylase AlkD
MTLEKALEQLESLGNERMRAHNSALAEIGIHFPKLRKRALAIGEMLGIYRDYAVSKGCTSPFAPIWINAMVSRTSSRPV